MVRCPKCFKDKPLGAKFCPHCTHRVTNSEVLAGEFWGLLWLFVIGTIIWNIIT